MLAEQKAGGYSTKYRFTGKEVDEETGLYYFGARYYDPRISLWYGVDPMTEKYPAWNPFNYTMNNPIKYFDPDGRELEISGPQADKAVEALNSSSKKLHFERDSKTGLVSASGKAKTKAEKQLLKVINDKNIKVNLVTTNDQNFDSKDGTKNIPLAPSAFEGSVKNVDEKVIATQIINIDNANIISSIIGEKVGETIMHEVNEAYFGAKDNPGGSYNSAYHNAHNKAEKLDKIKHVNFELNNDTKNRMYQVRKKSKDNWINLGKY